VSWYYLKRDKGKLEKRLFYLLEPLKLPLLGGGVNRWQIEGWFKTAKHRLHRFGQGTLLGIYRWFILSFCLPNGPLDLLSNSAFLA